MKLTVLIENTTLRSDLACEPGLSLHLQTQGHSLLFDSGKSGLFVDNAERLRIDLAQVELAILSHGHYDHSGGFLDFLEVNNHAPIYIHPKALEWHYSQHLGGEIVPIGIDSRLAASPRLIPVEGEFSPLPGLTLFSSVTGQKVCPQSNKTLFILEGDTYLPDPFYHEQHLLVQEANRHVLFAGCSHRGIVNILERARELSGAPLDAVVGGFHLSSPSLGTQESDETLQQIAEALLSSPQTIYYTCHCTGLKPFNRLHELMGDRILPLFTGDQLTL